MGNKYPEEEKLIKSNGSCWERIFYNTKAQIIFVLILCAFIGIGTPFIWQAIWKVKVNSCGIESDLRYDCFPQRPTQYINKSMCEEAKCCWDELATNEQIQCFYGLVLKDNTNKMPGYKIYKSFGNEEEAELVVDNRANSLNINTNNDTRVPELHKYLKLSVEHYTDSHFSVKIKPRDVNSSWISNYPDFEQLNRSLPTASKAKIIWNKKVDDLFTLTIRRKDSDAIIFNTGEYSPFIYCNGFIEITTLLPNDFIFGLGQRPSKTFKLNMTYPNDWQIFNKYNLNLTMNQTSWYGSHPFYMGLDNDHRAYGVLLRNTYPIELITNSRPSLTFRTIGGELDFHFFLGPEPKQVFQQLSTLIRKPALPPYWALGFHMCRTSCDVYKAGHIMAKMRASDITIPFDSDCISAALSTFLYPDKKNTLLSIAEIYKDDNKTKRLIVQMPQKPVVDPKLPVDTHWQNWDKFALTNVEKPLNNTGIFYDWCSMSDQSVTYPSFLDESVVEQLKGDFDMFQDIFIDGIILDYNTPLDLTYNRTKNMSKSCQKFISDNGWNKYYYLKLNENTPCLDLAYPNITDQHEPIEHLALHNLYGRQHMEMTKKALDLQKNVAGRKDKNNRKLVMSLSTFIGSGAYGGHIGTNMNATWEMMQETIVQTLEFGMYGIPLTGFPVCGFKGEAPDEELCLRWYQLASMQPFMISHRDNGQNLTDPITLAKNDELSREALKSTIVMRYRLLPYLYTLFYWAHREGDLVLRPLFYEFFSDKKTHRIDKQFLWGPALLISPVTEPKTSNVDAYFPKGIWYDFYSGKRVAARNGEKLQLSAIEYHINLHIRGGYVIPTQNEDQTTEQARMQNFTIVAALNEDREATGNLFIDDGITEYEFDEKDENEKYLFTNFNVSETNMIIDTKDYNGFDPLVTGTSTIIDKICIFGIFDPLEPQHFYVKIGDDEEILRDKYYYSYDQSAGVLTFKNLDIDVKPSTANTNITYELKWSYKKYTKK